jgi:hypothetical protein
VTLLVELPLNDDEGLSAACEPSGLCLVSQEHLAEEVLKIRRPPVGRRVGPRRRSKLSSMTSWLEKVSGWQAPESEASGSALAYSSTS